VAIFSLNHSFVGRTTHPPGSASLFARYVTRPEACTETIGQRMPTERGALMAWLDDQEQGDRKNARVIDKVVLALPIELSHEENLSLLQNFGERMTEGRASWAAGIHDGPGDADNPHAHIIFRDRDFETGKRVMLTTEKGSTQRFRDAWEQEVNISLERAGFEERVDKRSLKDQGVDREPQLHVGAGAQALHEKEYGFRSAEKEITRLIDGVPTTVTVNYPVIDEGKTRFQENEERIQRNLERARGLAENALEGEKLQAYHSEGTAALARPPKPLTEDEHIKHNLERAHTLAEIALEHEKLETYYSEAFHARFGGPPKPERAFTEDEKLWQMHDAMRGFAKMAQDDSDPLTSIIGEHLAVQTRRDIWREESPNWGPLPNEKGDSSPGARGPRKDAGDLLVGGGLAIFSRLSDSLESFFDDTPAPRNLEQVEQQMAEKKSSQQPTIERRTEQQQRGQEAELAAHRKQELEAYLDQRDKERHHDRGR
jgi:hypothetical protein